MYISICILYVPINLVYYVPKTIAKNYWHLLYHLSIACTNFLPSSTMWNSVLPHGPQFYHMDLSSTTCNSVLPRGTQLYHVKLSSTTWNSVLPRGTQFYHVKLSSTT